jgi:hypothetical protein
VASDPLKFERDKIEQARRELTVAVERAGRVLNAPGGTEPSN